MTSDTRGTIDRVAEARVAGYHVRIGYAREIECMTCAVPNMPRDHAAVCRTERGLEMCHVLAPVTLGAQSSQWRGKIVRRAREEDQVLWDQLQRLSAQAGDACRKFLGAMGLEDVLLDVEPLLDGRTLYFHFLGDPSPEIESYLHHLADVYQQEVTQSKFAQLLEHGCGPGCGTKEKACGTGGGCAVCSVAGKCSTTKQGSKT